jgi:hypothetical protein
MQSSQDAAVDVDDVRFKKIEKIKLSGWGHSSEKMVIPKFAHPELCFL